MMSNGEGSMAKILVIDDEQEIRQLIGIRDEIGLVSMSKRYGAVEAFEKPLDLEGWQKSSSLKMAGTFALRWKPSSPGQVTMSKLRTFWQPP